MFCRKCGKDNGNNNVCSICGNHPLTGHQFCQYCGKPTEEKQEYCLDCKTRLVTINSVRKREYNQSVNVTYETSETNETPIKKSHDTCKSCNSSNLIKGVKIGMTAESGDIGPAFKKGILRGNEGLYCDFCGDCGEVNRFYIKNTNHQFIVQK